MSSLCHTVCVCVCQHSVSVYNHIINTHNPLLIPTPSPERCSHRQKNDQNTLAESSASKPIVLRGEETHEFKRPLLRLYFKGLFSSVVLKVLQKR